MNKKFGIWNGMAILAILAIAGTSHAELVGHWTFDDVAGDNVPDSSDFMNNGTLMFGATTSSDVPEVLGGGQSLELNGLDQHVLVDHDDSLDILEAITISAWVKPIGNVAWDGILAKNPSDGSAMNHAGNYELRVENGSRTLTFLNQQGGVDDTQAYTGGPEVGESEWTHVAVTVDEEGVTFYRNGTLHSTRPLGGAEFFGEPNTNPLYIGSRADFLTTMDGLIDDVRLYNEVLPAETICSVAGFSPEECLPPEPPKDLIAATISSVSSELVTSFNRPAENVVNGSGLLTDGSHSISPDGTMWLNAGNGCCGDEPEPLGAEAEIVFDLGAVVSVDRMKIWNYNETLPGRDELLLRGAALADISVAGEDLEFTSFAESVELELAPGNALEDFGQIIDMGGASVRYVKLNLLENHGGDNDFIGLSEVQFFSGAGLEGDFDGNGVLDAADIDLLSSEVNAGTHNPDFDLNADDLVNEEDRVVWIEDLKVTWRGDANMDGLFNSGDLVQVFQRGEYEDDEVGNSGWADGDWNGDFEFDTADMVSAFQDGGFEAGPRPAGAVEAVPEPASGLLLTLAAACICCFSRRR